ncbi:MAG: nuclear transport factor 2 family protein [Flammeovirgaceae bacterium]|nr:nuclear transport factor 2 family protein [Flammeovirgaceae bacterium]
MQKLIPVIIISFMMACTSSDEAVVAEKNTKIVYQYIEASVSGDFETMESLLAEIYVGAGPGLKDTVTKAQHIANWKGRWINDFESIDYNRTETVTKRITLGPYIGDWVSDWAYVTVTYKNGLPPVTFWLNSVFRVRNGLIEQSRVFYDTGDVMRQQGFTFQPPDSIQ